MCPSASSWYVPAGLAGPQLSDDFGANLASLCGSPTRTLNALGRPGQAVPAMQKRCPLTLRPTHMLSLYSVGAESPVSSAPGCDGHGCASHFSVQFSKVLLVGSEAWTPQGYGKVEVHDVVGSSSLSARVSCASCCCSSSSVTNFSPAEHLSLPPAARVRGFCTWAEIRPIVTAVLDTLRTGIQATATQQAPQERGWIVLQVEGLAFNL